MKQHSDYAAIIVRYAMVLVFMLFGIAQVINPGNFIGYLPDFLFSLPYATILVIINGIIEIILAVLLAIGLFTRIVAAILAIHLLLITIEVGFNPTGFRDIGLTLATASIVFAGPDKWCLEQKLRKRK